MVVLGCFFEKKGVKLAPDMFAPSTCWRLVHVGARHVRARYMLAPDMFTPCTLEPLKLAPDMFAPCTLEPLKLAPIIFAPMPAPACARSCSYWRPALLRGQPPQTAHRHVGWQQ
jgi:hypothetical protein